MTSLPLQVVVISSPAWFSAGCDPKERRRLIWSFLALSSPGPHAFLLAVPVNRPADGEVAALDVLAHLLGPAAVGARTALLFTQTEELGEDETLEEYLHIWRKDLRELVDRCGHRYRPLVAGGEGGNGCATVRELLEMVEKAVAEEEEGYQGHLTCPLYQQIEQRVREKQQEIIKQRGGGGDLDAVREEAELSVDELDLDLNALLDVDALLPSPLPPPADASPPSFLQVCWVALTASLGRLACLVRREALLGALLGLFVGGPLGGVLGATVGSVATEVKRRKAEKKQ